MTKTNTYKSGKTWITNIEKIESADEQFEYKYRCSNLHSYNSCFLVSVVPWLYFFKSGLTSNVKATSHFSISVICSAASRIRIILLIPVRSEYLFKFLARDVIMLFFCICMKKPFREKGQRRLENMNNTKPIRPTSLNTNVQNNSQNDVTGKYFSHPTTCS